MSAPAQDLAPKLKQAHVQFLLSRLQGDELKQTIDRELTAIFAWGQSVTLNQIVDRPLLIGSIVRWVSSAPFNAELRSIVERCIIAGVQAELNNGASLTSLVPKQEYDKTITHLAKFEKIRVDIIRMILESPIYSELISDVLYHGIKDYVMTENVVVKKVPGVSALMKAGAKSLNKAMPKLEAAAEGTIKKFISSNLRSSVELSEKILNNALSESNIKSIADHFWGTMSGKEFGKFKEYVVDGDVSDTLSVGNDLWTELRNAEYLHNMIERIVEHLLDDIGDRNLAELVSAIGFDQSYLAGELEQVLPGTLANDLIMGYLGQRISTELDAFYASDGFISAFN